jgi:tetratricopeptide (TPR) repeat protein
MADVNLGTPEATTSRPVPSRRSFPWGLTPLLLAPLLIWNCWDASFLWLDDIDLVQKEGLVQPTTPLTAVWRPEGHRVWYQPLAVFAWRADRAIADATLKESLGERAWPAAIRVGNLALHLLGAFALWLLLRKLGVHEALAGFAAAAFALHPTACEVVCWPIEQKTALAGALGLLAVWLYVRAASWRGYVLAALAFAAALLSKPMALGFFPIVAAWEVLGRPGLQDENASGARWNWRRPKTWRRPMLRVLPWAVLSAAFLAVNLQTAHLDLQPPTRAPLFPTLLNALHLLYTYLTVLCWPPWASFYYEMVPVGSLADLRFWTALGILGVVVTATFVLARAQDRRLVAFGWLWFMGALSPALQVAVSFHEYRHDRFAYIAAAGAWLAVGLALQGLASRLSFFQGPRARSLVAGGVCAFALVWAGLSFERGGLYADFLCLMADATKKQPGSSYAHIQFGENLYLRAKSLRSAGHAEEARVLQGRVLNELELGIAAPDFGRYLNRATAHLQAAFLSYELGQTPAALAHCREAVNFYLTPRDMLLLHQIQGTIALADSQAEQAAQHFAETRRLQPSSPAVLLLYARAQWAWAAQLQAAGREDEARVRHMEGLAALRAVPASSPEAGEARRLLSAAGEDGPLR